MAATAAAGFTAKEAALRLLGGRPPVELWCGAVRFTLAENPGAFLGLGRAFPEAARRAILVGGVGLVLLGVLAYLFAAGTLRPARSVAAGLMLGGGIANLVDRLPDGLVTDYVVLSAGPLRTGVFNLPDAAILTGVVLWLIVGAVTPKAASDVPSSDA